MESILSIHDEVYPLKTRLKKSSPYLSNPIHIRQNTLNTKTNTISLFYQYIKTIIAQRTLYILGIFNLILAGIAIVCVTQAEDYPEYFSLVYISISIFIFYMAIIIFIIILQIIETYHEQNKNIHSSLTIPISLLTSKMTIQSNPMIVENLTTKKHLSRSQTLPLTSFNPHHTLSTSTSSSTTLKDFNQITSKHLPVLPKYYQSIMNNSKNYQSFALTTNNQLYSTIINNNSNTHLSSIIKPIPYKYHENNQTKMKFFKS